METLGNEPIFRARYICLYEQRLISGGARRLLAAENLCLLFELHLWSFKDLPVVALPIARATRNRFWTRSKMDLENQTWCPIRMFRRGRPNA